MASAANDVASPDDAEISRLVRDVAGAWEMPPVRLDQPGWRDRARSPRARRAAFLRGTAGRLGRAAGGAIVLTVAAAVLGVWLTRPSGPASPSQGPGRSPSGTARPEPSRVAASQLPKLLVNGDMPSPSLLIASIESTFSLVDLATGTVGQTFGQGQWGTDVRRAPNGVLYCICIGADGYESGSFTRMTVTWNRYDATGSVTGSAPVGDFVGSPDPRDVGVTEQAQHVAVHVSYTADPSIAFVGWTVHAHPAWRSGLDLVDVTTGAVLQRFSLPDDADGTETTRTGVDAPRVIGSIGGGRLAVARPTYRWSPPGAVNPNYLFSTDTFVVTFDGARLSGADTLAVASGCGGNVSEAGEVAGGAWWLACASVDGGQSVLRRVGADGRILGDTLVSGIVDVGDPSATSAV
ncbi:MAG: DUF5110 domain-containing protein, partial [Chloroflexi bacterium]|nr:DUF5110 domain-containing protein [Chloroflexota bacterium]